MFLDTAKKQLEEHYIDYVQTFAWGGLLIASIQLLVDTGYGKWAAIIAAMPVKDVLVIGLQRQEDRPKAVVDMLIADASVVAGALVMAFVLATKPDLPLAPLAAVGILSWLISTVVLLRPPPFGPARKHT